ncbi:hypothetical protein RUND412_009527 [Rhizina undulata]
MARLSSISKRLSAYLSSPAPSHSSMAAPPAFPPPINAVDEPQIPDPRVLTVTPLSFAECDGGPRALLPTISQCAVHLCLLQAFLKLKHRVTVEHAASFDIIFGDPDGAAKALREREVEGGGEVEWEAGEKERWWKAFVELAVERFEVWWMGVEKELGKMEDTKNINEVSEIREGIDIHITQPSKLGMETNIEISSKADEQMHDEKEAIYSTNSSGIRLRRLPSGMLPPLDVLMVWHSYMLNPKYYYEDCLRHELRMMLELEFPWVEVCSAINTSTWEYTLPAASTSFFTSLPHPSPQTSDLIAQLRTPISDNTPYPHPRKTIVCPNCQSTVYIPLSSPIPGKSYMDENFTHNCSECSTPINRSILGLAKFLSDINNLCESGKWLRGTRIDNNGNDAYSESPHLNPTNAFFKNAFAGHPTINFQTFPKWEEITQKISNAIESLPNTDSTPPRSPERCLLSYQTPHPTFSLDLVAAVGRQGGFVEKMDHHLWIRSPGLCGRLDATVLQKVRDAPGSCVYVDADNKMGTLKRAIGRYVRFFELFKRYPGRTMVPTLDVDVVWHSQQLSPMVYRLWCGEAAGRYIDHDDKLAEDVLEDGFGDTRKLWREEFREEYGRCVCWFCEVVLNNEECEVEEERECREKRRGLWGKRKKGENVDVRLRVEFHREVEKRRRKGIEGVGREGVFKLLEKCE